MTYTQQAQVIMLTESQEPNSLDRAVGEGSRNQEPIPGEVDRSPLFYILQEGIGKEWKSITPDKYNPQTPYYAVIEVNPIEGEESIRELIDTDDPIVSRILKYFRDNISPDLTIEQVFSELTPLNVGISKDLPGYPVQFKLSEGYENRATSISRTMRFAARIASNAPP